MKTAAPADVHNDVTTSVSVTDDVTARIFDGQVVSEMKTSGEPNGTNEFKTGEPNKSLDSGREQTELSDLMKSEIHENKSNDRTHDEVSIDHENNINTDGLNNSYINRNEELRNNKLEDYHSGGELQRQEQSTPEEVNNGKQLETTPPYYKMESPSTPFGREISGVLNHEAEDSDHREVIGDDDDGKLQGHRKDKIFSILRLVVSTKGKRLRDTTQDANDDVSRDVTDDDSAEDDDNNSNDEDQDHSSGSELDIIQLKLKPQPTPVSSSTHDSLLLSTSQYELPDSAVNSLHQVPEISTISNVLQSDSRQLSSDPVAEANRVTSYELGRGLETQTNTDHVQPSAPTPAGLQEAQGPRSLPVTGVSNTMLPLSNLCRLPVVSGYCFDRLIRWHYDVTSQCCRQFEYSGCGGNMNNFNDLNECMSACHRPGQTSICDNGLSCMSTIEGICLNSLIIPRLLEA